MPGMMDTVLNIGLNDETVQGLIQMSHDPRFAYDSYRRFVTMFGNVVMGVPHEKFEKLLDAAKARRPGCKLDSDLSAEALHGLDGADEDHGVGRHRACLSEPAAGPTAHEHRCRVCLLA